MFAGKIWAYDKVLLASINYLEEKTLLRGKSLHDMSLAQMDEIWEEAKKK